MDIVVLRDARKTLDRLPRNLRERIERAIEDLPEGDVKRLQGRDDYRLRVGGWRVIFAMEAERSSSGSSPRAAAPTARREA